MDQDLNDLTHEQLDELAEGIEGYPRSGNKEEKVAALTAALSTSDAEGDGDGDGDDGDTSDDTADGESPTEGDGDTGESAPPKRKARSAATSPGATSGRMVVIDGVRYRREDAERVRNKARGARNKRRG